MRNCGAFSIKEKSTDLEASDIFNLELKLQIVNHGIEERVVGEMMNVVRAFFELPWEEKAIHASDDVMCPVRYGTSLNTTSDHIVKYSYLLVD